MSIDNSGATLIFDDKTTTAIEAGKNRLTLLQAEELRLGKLNHALEAQLIKLTNEIASKEKTNANLVEDCTTLQGLISEKKQECLDLTKAIENIDKKLQADTDALADREASLKTNEADYVRNNKAVTKREVNVGIREDGISLVEVAIKQKLAIFDELRSKL